VSERWSVGGGNFIVQALNGEAFTMYGDNQQTPSFYCMDDLIDGMLRLMGCPVNFCQLGQYWKPRRARHACAAGERVAAGG
jgi:nucleoside-diphosphate-sugar epimerase